MRTLVALCLLAGLLLVTCGAGRCQTNQSPDSALPTLTAARKGFHTQLVPQETAHDPAPTPPARLFKLIKYKAHSGELGAYLSPNPGDGKKHPAIIWITGGDCNSIGDVWTPAPPSNDQTASAFRRAGIIMMFPSLRGGNDNPGTREGFFGEVDDVLAAAHYLAAQKYVDPKRIYLGGHSTGGTLVLLVAECSARFRAVFSFGPVDDVSGYSAEFLPFDTSSEQEIALRSPGKWLHAIKSPVYVFDGTEHSNMGCLLAMARTSQNPKVHFLPVKDVDHFSILAPLTRLLAAKVLHDTGAVFHLVITAKDLSKLSGG